MRDKEAQRGQMEGRAMGRCYRLRHTRRSEHPHQEVINNELLMFRSEVRISEKLLNCCCELSYFMGVLNNHGQIRMKV